MEMIIYVDFSGIVSGGLVSKCISDTISLYFEGQPDVSLGKFHNVSVINPPDQY